MYGAISSSLFEDKTGGRAEKIFLEIGPTSVRVRRGHVGSGW